MSEPQDGSFARRVASSFLVAGAGNLISKGVNVVALFLVLKMISPAELGLASIVLAIFAVLQSVTELGLGVALVQAKDATRDQIDSLFWVSMMVAGGLYLLLLAAAPLAGWAYGEPELTALLRVQGLAVVISALYLVPRNLLVRDLRFGRVTIADNVSLLLASGAMIAAASMGYGPWAIIAGEVVNRAGQLVMFQLFNPYLPRLHLRLAEVRSMVSFGLYATGSRLLYNFYINADYLVVGKVFGPAAVGIYTVAFRIVADPVKTLASVVNQVAYPAFAKLQDEPERLKTYLFTMARGNLATIGTVLTLVCVFIEDGLLIAGYDQWLGAVPLVRIFAISGLLLCVAPLVPQLLNAMGQARLNMAYSALAAVVMPVAFFVGSRFGVEGVAWAWAMTYPALAMVLFAFGARQLGLSLPAFTARALGGLVVFVPVAVVAIGLKVALGTWTTLSPLWVIVIGALLTLAVGARLTLWREREAIRLVLGKGKPASEPGADQDATERTP